MRFESSCQARYYSRLAEAQLFPQPILEYSKLQKHLWSFQVHLAKRSADNLGFRWGLIEQGTDRGKVAEVQGSRWQFHKPLPYWFLKEIWNYLFRFERQPFKNILQNFQLSMHWTDLPSGITCFVKWPPILRRMLGPLTNNSELSGGQDMHDEKATWWWWSPWRWNMIVNGHWRFRCFPPNTYQIYQWPSPT